jgi:hypothetical protein
VVSTEVQSLSVSLDASVCRSDSFNFNTQEHKNEQPTVVFHVSTSSLSIHHLTTNLPVELDLPMMTN